MGEAYKEGLSVLGSSTPLMDAAALCGLAIPTGCTI